MRFLLLIVLLAPSLRAETPGTIFRPYNHAGATARLRAALHQEQRPPEYVFRRRSPSTNKRLEQRTSTSTYFVPPKGFANCSDGSCRR
jgi:hypothetical protein